MPSPRKSPAQILLRGLLHPQVWFAAAIAILIASQALVGHGRVGDFVAQATALSFPYFVLLAGFMVGLQSHRLSGGGVALGHLPLGLRGSPATRCCARRTGIRRR
jgi:hypothetical protein